MNGELLLGDEAVARAAIDAGVGAAYGYPGTPSTEILETLINENDGTCVASWATNEKAAYEQALGASMAGARAIVTMKHVGLNVAADPFVNSVLLDIRHGLVLVVADDPGMHSSQNEQDSRFYADFARAVCLEPKDQQEAYDMTLAAFGLSERIHRPVVVRMVTRVAHSRAIVRAIRPDEPVKRAPHTREPGAWSLLPQSARGHWRSIVEEQKALLKTEEARRWNRRVTEGGGPLTIVTSGIAANYLAEVVPELDASPSHLHVGHYPVDPDLFADLPRRDLLVLEDGYPFLERWLRSVVPDSIEVLGRETGHVPPTGELTPDIVRAALGLPEHAQRTPQIAIGRRAPQLCPGCPHAFTLEMIGGATTELASSLVTSDIGCYALGALPPHSILESIVCMGASIGMAKGAAEAGQPNVVATIGDSTFLHSGIPALIDAARANTPMTVVIMDNETVAMTGGQPTAASPERLEVIVRAVGVPADHVVTLEPVRSAAQENERALSREIAYDGLSVVIARRSCIKVAVARPKERA